MPEAITLNATFNLPTRFEVRRAADASARLFEAAQVTARAGLIEHVVATADQFVADGYEVDIELARKFTADKLKELEAKGWAMRGGRYPIETMGDLHNAIQAFGRGKAADRAAIMAHIKRQAKRLGAMNLLPDNW